MALRVSLQYALETWSMKLEHYAEITESWTKKILLQCLIR
uniref:Uncharacterized protein n=1 Tax=Rhizophora mucronata TaxID=61149 RepID=A0A2P2NFX5_RHIMU